jgi:hypothetical protein
MLGAVWQHSSHRHADNAMENTDTRNPELTNTRDPELLETWRQEAASFFAANQAARGALERAMGLVFAVAAVGAALSTKDGALPIPAFLWLLLSYVFQQYADLTVLGMARRRLEEAVQRYFHGRPGLIYETYVVDVRKNKADYWGVTLLQALMVAAIVTATVLIGHSAFGDSHPIGLRVGFTVATTIAFGSAARSAWEMLHAEAKGLDNLPPPDEVSPSDVDTPRPWKRASRRRMVRGRTLVRRGLGRARGQS